MTLREVFAPSLGKTVKLGRRPEKVAGPHFRLRNYLRASLPDPPASIDYTQSASAALTDIYQNDQLGDCVIAALYHLLGLWTGNATGTPFHASPAQIVAMYSAIGGYVPGDPSTDNGCDMTTAMNWIVANGYANGDKPLGWVRIDGTNPVEVRQALWLFEGLDFGVGLPDAWINPFPQANGFTWDVAGASDPNNGHSYMAAGYNDKGLIIDTWGLLGLQTDAAVAQYATTANGGEIDVLLSADMIAKGAAKSPAGVDWVSLVQDFDQIGGAVPAPSPAPSPPPTPTGPATLAMAQAWAAAGINGGYPLLTRAQAAALANAGLAANWPTSS